MGGGAFSEREGVEGGEGEGEEVGERGRRRSTDVERKVGGEEGKEGGERRRKGGNGEEKGLAVEKREGERMVAEKRGNKERQ